MDRHDLEIKALIDDWHIAYKRGNDFDLWGQPVEAIDSYTRLAANMRYESHPEGCIFTDEQKKVLKKLATCLELRAKTLHSPGKLEQISLTDMKKIDNSIRDLTILSARDFPVDVPSRGLPLTPQLSVASEASSDISSQASKVTTGETLYEEESCLDERLCGSLLPPPDVRSDQTVVTLRLEKIALKDAAQYIDSFMSLSLKGGNGQDLSPSQDTPVLHSKDDLHVYFGVDVHLQKPLEELPEDMAIFLEFKHYKPKKKLISTKCWAFMERDEIKEGAAVLELYKKPTDFKRKKIHLLTSKPMYLHVKVILNG